MTERKTIDFPHYFINGIITKGFRHLFPPRSTAYNGMDKKSAFFYVNIVQYGFMGQDQL